MLIKWRLKPLTKKWDKKLTNFKNVSTVSNTLSVTSGQQWPHSQLSARRVVYTGELQNWPEISWFAWWFQANFAVQFSCGRLLMLLLDEWQMDKYCYIVRQWMFYNSYKLQTLLIKFATCLLFTLWAHSRMIRTNVYILNTIAQKVFPRVFLQAEWFQHCYFLSNSANHVHCLIMLSNR